jgi:tetratricopeptide (TPR) repeat protein
MRTILFFIIVLCFGSLFAQRTKSNTARINFTQYPTVPIEGVKEIGIQVYTANLSFNRDTLRLYLDNIDIMKSDFEQLSKVDFKALNQVSIVGGEGDITVDMALGQPVVLSKELKTASCMIAKDGCVQYYYKVKYNLPAVVQARTSEGILNTWTLDSEMEFQFGNEQIEKHTSTAEASITSVQVINYTSEMDLALAFNEVGESALTRKALIKQLGRMAESIYDNLFFNETRLKLDIAYGAGSAADYAETEKASENAIAALERLDYASLKGPIKIWESWLERYSREDKKAAVNNKVAQGFHENLSIAFTFTNEFDKARKHLDSAIELAQIGIVNRNEVDRLQEFHEFIDKQEKVKKI